MGAGADVSNATHAPLVSRRFVHTQQHQPIAADAVAKPAPLSKQALPPHHFRSSLCRSAIETTTWTEVCKQCKHTNERTNEQSASTSARRVHSLNDTLMKPKPAAAADSPLRSCLHSRHAPASTSEHKTSQAFVHKNTAPDAPWQKCTYREHSPRRHSSARQRS